MVAPAAQIAIRLAPRAEASGLKGDKMTDVNNPDPKGSKVLPDDSDATTEIINERVTAVLPGIGAQGSGGSPLPPSDPTVTPPTPASGAAPSRSGVVHSYPRKIVIAGFVLGIVGTSLAFLALILGFVNLARDGGGHGPRGHSQVTITEDFDGRSGRVTERFTEDFGERGDRGTSGRRGPHGMRERLEITEDFMEDTQSVS